MNQKELQTRRNAVRRLFEHTSGIHVNCVRINTGSTLEHELAKFLLCRSLAKEGKDFMTEAIFENRKGRADIVVLDDSLIIEITASEKEESLERKATVYPLPIQRFRAKELLRKMTGEGGLTSPIIEEDR